MSNNDNPKMTPAPPIAAPAGNDQTAKKEDGGSTAITHLAMLSGLGLLGEIAELGEQMSDISAGTRTGDSAVKAIDPRDRIDPRKKFIPR